MNTTIKYLNLIMITIPVIWISCNEKETEALLPGDFENGILITNEGNYGDGDASLSYYDFESEKVYNNVFALANDGQTIGDVMQSMHLNQDHAFLVVNNSNKVEALNLADMTIDYTISDLKLPRYMTSQGDKGYVSEWVSFADVGRVAIIDLTTGGIQKSINTDYGAEGVLIADGKLFVSNNFSTTLTVIDLSSETVVKTIDVGSSPGEMEVDADGDIWLICGGGYDSNFNPQADGKLFEIDPAEASIKQVIELGKNVSTKMTIDPTLQTIYYFSGTSAYEFTLNANTASDNPLISEDNATAFYGIGTDASGRIYLADQKGFIESGEVFVYEDDGTFVEKYIVGRGPNGFTLN